MYFDSLGWAMTSVAPPGFRTEAHPVGPSVYQSYQSAVPLALTDSSAGWTFAAFTHNCEASLCEPLMTAAVLTIAAGTQTVAVTSWLSAKQLAYVESALARTQKVVVVPIESG